MRLLLALLSGALFGAGLYISGMTDTTRVQGWLDVFGNWDPTLAFVMGGAILPMTLAWRLTRVAGRPVAGGQFPAAPMPELDRRLILGSTLFGMGWGLAGLCPGPAIASLGFGGISGIVFLAAMLLGMMVAPGLKARLDSPVPAE
ncbi:YeeE/YedE family protein [Pseudooceanicola batsensis HTCC2597]|uniref:YeeE/YedE family protein n=1 Tax=Pseudooceanicola batsensis (strain ATCC BAA-863 / DSM 15984 / KCTC 12145 / HTCC2597) TaxID=252305 RepID=A3TSY9_PSEBH|nr:DUF6691 family protein [Pseudooceanicola batsensis]EAQ04766.1 YeeE/YedE family protein [Pseudooceanicola batsensis HTCC2597]